MAKKILITSFEPFGLIGKFARGQNTSQLIMDELRNDHLLDDHLDDNEFIYITLPVDESAAATLIAVLQEHEPDGIISMGEHMLATPGHVIVEPYAYDVEPSTAPDLCLQFREHIDSAFVQDRSDKPSSSHIGNYYCNHIYKTGLNWAAENDSIPVAFVHVPVLGNQQVHKEQIQGLIKEMQSYTPAKSTGFALKPA